jgi:hypothetical protein
MSHVTTPISETARDEQAALAALRIAYEHAVADIRSNPNKRRAYADATTLAELLRAWSESAADLRAIVMSKIYDDDKLSLVTLADMANVTKQRASQLVRTGREIREGDTDEHGTQAS